MSTTSAQKLPYDFTKARLRYNGRRHEFTIGPKVNARLNALIDLAQRTGTLTSRQARKAFDEPDSTTLFYVGVLVRLGVLTPLERGYYKLGADYARQT
jgi:hypothetical protein